MSVKKLCPFTLDKRADCKGPICAWWCKYANDCAVSVIAGILADNTIYQNIWGLDKEET